MTSHRIRKVGVLRRVETTSRGEGNDPGLSLLIGVNTQVPVVYVDVEGRNDWTVVRVPLDCRTNIGRY